jgi:hypothetical protein
VIDLHDGAAGRASGLSSMQLAKKPGTHVGCAKRG